MLAQALKLYDLPQQGKIKCSIHYEEEINEVLISKYTSKKTEHLKLVEIPAGFDYRFKFADRKIIDELFSKKGYADDILMTRHGWVLDTSIANIAFRKNNRWFTPSNPLLAGTTWKRLIKNGVIIPRPIHQNDIDQFDGYKVFNAMNAWEEAEERNCRGILMQK